MLSQIDKQIVGAWHRYALSPRIARLTGRGPRATGPRIALVGNCQGYGVAYAMKVLDPSATVDLYSVTGRSHASIELFAKTLGMYDHVFSQIFLEGHLRGGESRALQRLLPKTIMFPSIVFAAFHPDLIYLTGPDGHIGGPLGHYHSALCLFAFRKSLPLDAANALFNENVFRAVGYFDVWNHAARELIDSTRNGYDLDLSAEFANWSRRGVFMYSVLHPKSFVLHDVAKNLMRRAGLKVRTPNFEHYDIADLARAEVYPVYPPIAHHFGGEGSYLFKTQNQHLSNGVGAFYNLPEYLAGSYRAYEALAPAALSHPRVDAWVNDAATSEMLVRLAQENLKAGLTPAL